MREREVRVERQTERLGRDVDDETGDKAGVKDSEAKENGGSRQREGREERE